MHGVSMFVLVHFAGPPTSCMQELTDQLAREKRAALCALTAKDERAQAAARAAADEASELRDERDALRRRLTTLERQLAKLMSHDVRCFLSHCNLCCVALAAALPGAFQV